MDFDSLELLLNRASWGNSKYYKGVFQTFLYSWLYFNKYPATRILRPGIYLTSNLFGNDFSFSLKDKSKKTSVDNYIEYHAEFDKYLVKLVSDIFNPEINFEQTSDEKRCKYCMYADICHR